jgi:hypothetical protein
MSTECTQDHSDLIREWIACAREVTSATERDRLVYALGHHRRIAGRTQAAVVGGVVDTTHRGGPAVILVALSDDGDGQQCGVGCVAHARAVIEALHMAWPELRDEPKGEA